MSDRLCGLSDCEVTSFYGGDSRGRCLQLTKNDEGTFVVLTHADVDLLLNVLHGWLDGSI